MKKFLVLIICLLMLLTVASCKSKDDDLDPDEPITLTMWHVYGEQADSPMNRLVEEFNDTVGYENGVILDVTMISNSSEIGSRLLDAQSNAPGVPDMPDLFFCHTGNAAALGIDNLLDWNSYFSKQELSSYVDDFLEEGIVDGHQIVFPVSKSTHLIFLNGTRFEQFSKDTGVKKEDLSTWDGFFKAAELYYEWSNGAPFCAMDFLLQDVELNVLSQGGKIPMDGNWYDFSDDTLHEAWKPFAEALVKGHIVVSDLFANTQVMTGEVLSGLGSSAAILYYNDVVTYPDNTTEPMDLMVLPMPSDGKPVVTQAGVGLCSLYTTDKKAKAASLFAHWFTEAERNLDFVAETGYMPVNNESFEAIDSYDFTDKEHEKLYSALKNVRENSKAVTEHSEPGYFEHVNKTYGGLRELCPKLNQRYKNGEDLDLLAEETWAILKSIHD